MFTRLQLPNSMLALACTANAASNMLLEHKDEEVVLLLDG